MNRYRSLLGLICGSILLHGCGSGSSTPPPPVATHLLVTAESNTVTAGAAMSVTVNALDNSGAIVSSYSGTVHFTSTDSQAMLPADTALSGGTTTVLVTLKTAGTQTITAGDTASKLAVGTSGSITVNGSAQTVSITSGNPPDGIAGRTYYPYRCSNSPVVWCGGFPLTASGGVPPYNWSWAGASGSSTPPGLSIDSSGRCPLNANLHFDWRITCFPEAAGTYNVTITVSDSASPPNNTSANYTINITNPPPPQINMTPAPSEGAIDLSYNFKFTATDGLAPLTWSQTGALPPGLNLASDGTLSGTPTATGSFPITMMVVDSVSRSAPPQNFTIEVAAHGFKLTGRMSVPKVFHTVTLLQDGKVLVAGGANKVAANLPPRGTFTVYASTETYDPATRTLSLISSMLSMREFHTATLLNTGKVLIAGGWDGESRLATAEIFNPVAGTFTATSNMTTARQGHQASLLSDGKVLITGGSGLDGTGNLVALSAAEIFDPSAGTFTSTGSMSIGRTQHTQTSLKDGKVLLAGGRDSAGNTITTAEIYDPATGTFSTPIDMTAARAVHTATLLSSGKVLLTGGNDGTNQLDSAEIFDPSLMKFAATGKMANARSLHTATLLSDGTVLVAGGQTTSLNVYSEFLSYPLALTELFDPASETFSGTGSLVNARANHKATILNDGSVLVIGGSVVINLDLPGSKILSSAETYQ